MAERFTKPYVDALFGVAGSADAVEALLPSLAAFAASLAASDDLRALLANPGVDRARRRAVVKAVAERSGCDALAARLLETLLGNGRLLHLRAVLAALRERIDRERNVVEARVTTATPLAADAAADLRAALEARMNRTIRFATGVDPALLGGFVVKLGSEVFDASLASRLERARRALHAG